jgi:hypothetical protein
MEDNMPELNKIAEAGAKTGTLESKQPIEATVLTVPSSKSTKVKYSRPPIEQITEDAISYLQSKTIGGHRIEKLGFSCGKMIYGFHLPDAEFRIMAFKARKKSLSVENKSRGMYFFGIDNVNAIPKDMSNLPITDSSRGACSCQVKKPVHLTLDKVTFTENFNKDATLALGTLKRLIDLAIDQKTVVFYNLSQTMDKAE